MKTKAVRRTPMRRPFSAYATDPCAFIDDLITVNERGAPFRLLPHQRAILQTAFTFDAEGRLAWDTFLYSCPKKSGKTTLNAMLTAWWAFTQDPPNELYILANDLEQAESRVFSTLRRLIQKNAALAASATVLDKHRIVLSNETELKALASDYAGEAGANQGLSSWDELWASTSESGHRLWEEFTPVPTGAGQKRNSIRLVTTYAGWEGESDLLFGLYRAGVGPAEHPEGGGVPCHPELPVYVNAAARLLVYWDHEPRLPWQTARYYTGQRTQLRPNAYTRFHENRWTQAESRFITAELWDACVDPAARPLLPALGRDPRCPIWIGIDAGVKSDYAAVVAVTRTADNQIRLVRYWLFKPGPGNPINLESTLEQAVWEGAQGYALQMGYADPFQLHRSLVALAQGGLPMKEFPQTQQNTTKMGVVLYDLVKHRNLILYADDEFRQQALNTVAIETPRGFRLAKEKSTRKIDLIAALAMACVAALDEPLALPPLTEEELAEHAWQEARVMSNLGFPPVDRLASHPMYVRDDTGRNYEHRNMNWYRRDAAGTRHDLWQTPAPEPEDDGMGPMIDTGRS